MKYLGVATSPHQIEGNTYNDWTLYEKKGLVPEVGEACRSWEKMEDDIKLLKHIGANAYRFGIEWSRIEPEEGMFNIKALDRYRRFIDKLLKEGIEPFITLHHFTNPVWFHKMGGWTNPESMDFFVRYVDFITRYIKVRFWITINEPNVYAYNSYVAGIWPPMEKSILKAVIVVRHMLKASGMAYKVIHKNVPKSFVGIAHHLRVFKPFGKLGKIPVFLREYLFNFLPIYSDVFGVIPPPSGFMEPLKDRADFVGINYYTRDTVKFSLKNLFGEDVSVEGIWRNSLGWEVYPEGIYHLLKKYNFNKPVIITESGITTENEVDRERFIREHLKWIKKALDEGVKVVGYFYWSLMDNYEWAEGYNAHFGLFTRDRKPKSKINLKEIWKGVNEQDNP
ncbi:MAG: family 1 glycosylhydrolase [candidate division WOR-3 bacterium]